MPDIIEPRYKKVILHDPTGAAVSTSNKLPVDVGTVAVTGGLTNTELRATPVPVSGTLTANAGTNLNTSLLALEAGGNLASVKTNTDKIPALGQALAAASVPVILPATTITTLTPPAAITGFALETGGNLATIAGKDFATQTTLALIKAKTDNLDVLLSTRTKPADTQTVSGTVTANAGTNLNTSALALDATLTGGTAKAIARGAAKGATTAADITSTAQSVDRQGLDVQIRTSSGVAVDTFGGGTQYATGAARGTSTGTLAMVDDGTLIRSASGDTTGKLNVNVSNIPHAIIDSGSTTAVTGNVTVVQPTGTNLHAVLDANSGVDIGKLTANQSVNTAQINGVTPLMGSGIMGTGSARVTIASDNDPLIVKQATAANLNATVVGTGTFVTQSTLAAETTKVIGTVNQGTSPWITAGGGTAGTAASGVVTVQGIASMTKLLVTPDSVALPANQSVNVAQFGGTNVVTGGVAGVQSVGGNVANAVTATANPVPVGGIFTTTPATLTTGQTATLQFTAAQNIKNDITTLAGTAVTAATAGVQKVGISGATAATLDAADNAAAPANSILHAGLYSTTIPALTSGNSAAVRLDSTGAQAINTEGRKATYSLAVLDFAPLSSATAPSFSVTGSSTKTVRILRIGLSATAATGGVATLNVRRFSVLSGGTAASQSANIAKHDSNNGTATAVVNTWSVVATTATSAGLLRSLRFEYDTPAATIQPQLYEWFFGDKNGQGLVLRGTSEFAGICFNGIATTPTSEIYVEWTEE